MAQVNCVIVNYNDAKTTACLVQVLQAYSVLQRIVVVDNASTDDSLMQLRLLESNSKVVVLDAGHNGGYGAGNNQGVKYSVLADGADYVLIANPDVQVSRSVIRLMAAAMERVPALGAVTAAMRDPEFKNKPNGWPLRSFWGELLSMGPVSRRLFRRFLEYPGRYFRCRPLVPVDVVHGSLLMVRGSAFLACGGYDENIFLYQEEAVLGKRMQALGYRTALLNKVFYYHQHSASIGLTYRSQAARQQLRHDSTMYYFKQYLHIGRFQEMAARLWFAGIMAEIAVSGRLYRPFRKKNCGSR